MTSKLTWTFQNRTPLEDERSNRERTSDANAVGRHTHPVGTGVGALGGAAAGAAAGSVAGPAGTAAGAVVGAVAGGIAGKATAHAVEDDGEHGGHSRGNRTGLDQLIGYEVIDTTGDHFGSIESVWEDSAGQPAYLGVKTSWMDFGRHHVLPAYSAEVNDAQRRVRVPFNQDIVKDAPSFVADDELDSRAEQQVREYYQGRGLKWQSGQGQHQTTTKQKQPPRQKKSAGGQGNQQEEANIQLREEEVKVGKRQVEAGGVRLRKIIRTETVNRPVQLQREEIVIERVPANDATRSRTGQTDFNQEEIYIPLRREEAVVQKESHIKEEVRVSKKSQTEQKNISETVRTEDVEIENRGEAKRMMDKPKR